MSIKKVIVKINCRKCYQKYSIEAGYQDLLDWREGALIQEALPYLNLEDRELLISKTCGSCWRKMFNKNHSDAQIERHKKEPVYCGDCLVPVVDCSHNKG